MRNMLKGKIKSLPFPMVKISIFVSVCSLFVCYNSVSRYFSPKILKELFERNRMVYNMWKLRRDRPHLQCLEAVTRHLKHEGGGGYDWFIPLEWADPDETWRKFIN